MKKISLFTKIGFSPQSEEIYTTLLTHGPLTLTGIAKITGLYRPLLYRQIPELLNKHIISEKSVGKRTTYSAESPESLQTIIDHLQMDLQAVLPALQTHYDSPHKQPTVRCFYGRRGIQDAFDYILAHAKHGEILYRYESSDDYAKHKKYYSENYWRRATGTSWEMQKFVITNETTQRRRRNRIERYSKVIPKSFDPFEYNITQIIYGDNVAFIDYDSETASLIENAKFAKFQRQIYKLLFSKLA